MLPTTVVPQPCLPYFSARGRYYFESFHGKFSASRAARGVLAKTACAQQGSQHEHRRHIAGENNVLQNFKALLDYTTTSLLCELCVVS